MRRRLILLAALLLPGLALSGCGNDWSGRWTTYHFKVQSEFQTPVRLSADGEALGTCDPGGAITVRRKDRGVRLSRRTEAIAAEMLTPDGWKPAGRVQPDTFAPEWEEKEVQAGRPVEIGVLILAGQQAQDSRTTLVIDNRNHAAVKIRLGELRLDIAEGKVWQEQIPGPTTPEGSVVRVDDREIGRISTLAEVEKRRTSGNVQSFELPWWLIDPGGSRTYSRRLVLYVPVGSFQTASPPEKVRIEPAFLHDLGFMNGVSLFTPAPSTTTSTSGYDSRHEILDEP